MKNLLGLFGVILLLTCHSCKDNEDEGPVGPDPIASGSWTATTGGGFGTFDFIVNSESTHISKFSFTFNCTIGNTTFNGTTLSVMKDPGWQIVNRDISFTGTWDMDPDPFSSEVLTLTLSGSFDESGITASGAWNTDFKGIADSGEWTAAPSGK